jgi:hypothetical protein
LFDGVTRACPQTGISEKARNTGKVLGSQCVREALFFLRATIFQVF